MLRGAFFFIWDKKSEKNFKKSLLTFWGEKSKISLNKSNRWYGMR